MKSWCEVHHSLQHYVFIFIKIQDIYHILSPPPLHVQLKTVERLLYASFGAVASPLQSSLSGCDDTGVVLLFTQILLYLSSTIFTKTFAVVLGSICSLLTVAAGTVALYLCTFAHTDEHCTIRHLEIAPRNQPDLRSSTKLFLKLLVDFFWPN